MRMLDSIAAVVAVGVIAGFSAQASAADLMNDQAVIEEAPVAVEEAAPVVQHSMKDTPVEVAPVVEQRSNRNWYLRGDIGYSFFGDFDVVDNLGSDLTSDDEDDAFFGGLGLGMTFGRIRADVTADYASGSEFTTYYPGSKDQAVAVDMDLWTFMANVYYDFDMGGRFTPYVGGGIGMAYADFDSDKGISGTDSSFAWSLMAGLSMNVANNLDLDVGYRYMNYGDLAADSTKIVPVNPAKERIVEDLDAHQVRVGLRYTFGGNRSYEDVSNEAIVEDVAPAHDSYK